MDLYIAFLFYEITPVFILPSLTLSFSFPDIITEWQKLIALSSLFSSSSLSTRARKFWWKIQTPTIWLPSAERLRVNTNAPWLTTRKWRTRKASLLAVSIHDICRALAYCTTTSQEITAVAQTKTSSCCSHFAFASNQQTAVLPKLSHAHSTLI